MTYTCFNKSNIDRMLFEESDNEAVFGEIRAVNSDDEMMFGARVSSWRRRSINAILLCCFVVVCYSNLIALKLIERVGFGFFFKKNKMIFNLFSFNIYFI